MHRTSLLLDPAARRASRELALHYDCSTSEAIRRAILAQYEAMKGVTAQGRAQRRAALKTLVSLFERHDADAEIKRLKSEDPGF